MWEILRFLSSQVASRSFKLKSLNDASLIEGGQNPDSYAETVPGPPPGVRQFMPEIRQREEWSGDT